MEKSDSIIELLVTAMCGQSPKRDQHIFRESLRQLVRAAQLEGKSGPEQEDKTDLMSMIPASFAMH